MNNTNERTRYISDIVARASERRNAIRHGFWLRVVYLFLSIVWFAVTTIASVVFWMALNHGILGLFDRPSGASFALYFGEVPILLFLFLAAGVGLFFWSFPVMIGRSKLLREAAFFGNWDKNLFHPLNDGHLRHYARQLIQYGDVVVGENLSASAFIERARQFNRVIRFRWLAILWAGVLLFALVDSSQVISGHNPNIMHSD